jgi:beta-lactam-binding protein with PASTA domain
MKSKTKQNNPTDFLKEIYSFLTSKTFLKHLSMIAAFLVAILLLTLLWLRIYTNHSQKLELADYIGTNIEEATEDAKSKSFQIIVNDSVHIVGKAGGEIIEQNPKPNSMVKEKRKIYVTTTKHDADQFDSESLPPLYGRDFDRKKRELSYQDITCKVVDFKFDPGEPNHILEVYYEGQVIEDASGRRKGIMIDKGSTMEFILSKRSGQQLDVPDLTCQPLSQAKFLMESINLIVGQVNEDGKITDASSAWVYDQNPRPGDGAVINSGEGIDLYITAEKPKKCQ